MFEKIASKLNSGGKRTIAVKKNIIASIFIRCISILVSLLVIPVTLGYVSSELYGVWLTLSSVMIWLNFFDVGFTQGLKNKLAEALSIGDVSKGKALVSTTYFMMFVIFLPLCILLEFLVPLIDWCNLLNVSPEYSEEITNTLYVIIGFVCLQMIFSVISSVVAAYQKVALSNAFVVLGNIFALVAIFIMTKLVPPSLVGLGVAFSGLPVLVLFISSSILYKTQFREVAPSVKTINLSLINDLFDLGIKFFIIQIQVVVMFQTTNILISYVSNPDYVTAYNIAHKYLGVALMLYTIILAPLWPAFTDAYTKKDYPWMNRTYKRMIQIYIISAFLVFTMILVSPWVYNIWINGKAVIPFEMTIMVGIYMLVYTWDSLQVQLINGIGKLKLQTYVTLIGMFIHIPFSLYLGKYFGAYGVLYSMTLVNVIYVIFFTIQIRKLLKDQATGIWKE